MSSGVNVKNQEFTIPEIDRIFGTDSHTLKLVPHENGTIMVNLKEDKFYLLLDTGKRREYRSIYRVIEAGCWSALIKVLKERLVK